MPTKFKIKLYRLLRPIVRREVVILVDFNKEEHVRFARYKKNIGLTAKRFGFGIHNCRLNADGSVEQYFRGASSFHHSYVYSWRWA